MNNRPAVFDWREAGYDCFVIGGNPKEVTYLTWNRESLTV